MAFWKFLSVTRTVYKAQLNERNFVTYYANNLVTSAQRCLRCIAINFIAKAECRAIVEQVWMCRVTRHIVGRLIIFLDKFAR